MALNTDYLKSVPGVLKLLEIVLVVTAFGILRGGGASVNETTDADFFLCGVLVTAIIITPLLLVCYLMERTEIQQSILEVSLNFLLFVFLFSAGVAGSAYWDKHISIPKSLKQKSLAMISFCIIASFAYLADTVFAVKKYRVADMVHCMASGQTGGGRLSIFHAGPPGPRFYQREKSSCVSHCSISSTHSHQ